MLGTEKRGGTENWFRWSESMKSAKTIAGHGVGLVAPCGGWRLQPITEQKQMGLRIFEVRMDLNLAQFLFFQKLKKLLNI